MAKSSVEKEMANFLAKAISRHHRRSETPSATQGRRMQVKAGPHPTAEMNLRMHFVTASKGTGEMGVKKRSELKPETAALLRGFSEADEQRLRDLEPQILKWIGDSDKNAALFYANPLRALSEAGLKLDQALLAKIRRIRNASTFSRSPLPQAELKSVSFTK